MYVRKSLNTITMATVSHRIQTVILKMVITERLSVTYLRTLYPDLKLRKVKYGPVIMVEK